MAKLIKYRILSANNHNGTEDNYENDLSYIPKILKCKTQADYDANYPIAEREAIGEIVAEGAFEADQPTQVDRIEAQLTYTAMITDTLLEV